MIICMLYCHFKIIVCPPPPPPLLPPAVSEWSIEDVCVWLKAIGLEDYTDNMRSHDVGGAELLSLQATDLVVSVRE